MVANPLVLQKDSDTEIYGIKLEMFEGPLDLLLFLIRKNELDIYDIPIADITRQFLEYVDIIQSLDLEQAGDFVLMAATLMKIKSRMLLPAEDGDEDEVEDPREELVRRLLEYQQFKEVATWLESEQEANRDAFYRGSALDLEGVNDAADDPLAAYRSVGLFDLLSAFKQVLITAPKVEYHEVAEEGATSEECAETVLEMLSQKNGQVSFTELVANRSRIVMIVTFIALLELIKSGEVLIRQAEPGSEIWIYKQEKERSEDGPAPATESEPHV
ncbi:MAG: segregation/condensation protein A [bacterium]|nr:segregation/condensation protein A [bacterium]